MLNLASVLIVEKLAILLNFAGKKEGKDI